MAPGEWNSQTDTFNHIIPSDKEQRPS